MRNFIRKPENKYLQMTFDYIGLENTDILNNQEIF